MDHETVHFTAESAYETCNYSFIRTTHFTILVLISSLVFALIDDHLDLVLNNEYCALETLLFQDVLPFRFLSLFIRGFTLLALLVPLISTAFSRTVPSQFNIPLKSVEKFLISFFYEYG